MDVKAVACCALIFAASVEAADPKQGELCGWVRQFANTAQLMKMSGHSLPSAQAQLVKVVEDTGGLPRDAMNAVKRLASNTASSVYGSNFKDPETAQAMMYASCMR